MFEENPVFVISIFTSPLTLNTGGRVLVTHLPLEGQIPDKNKQVYCALS